MITKQESRGFISCGRETIACRDLYKNELKTKRSSALLWLHHYPMWSYVCALHASPISYIYVRRLLQMNSYRFNNIIFVMKTDSRDLSTWRIWAASRTLYFKNTFGIEKKHTHKKRFNKYTYLFSDLFCCRILLTLIPTFFWLVFCSAW